MTSSMPPELMSPEERSHQAAELERRVAHEWLRCAITEALVLWFPFAVFLVIYVTTDAIPDNALVPIAVAGGGVTTTVIYWVTKRIWPLSHRLQRLRQYEESERATTDR